MQVTHQGAEVHLEVRRYQAITLAWKRLNFKKWYENHQIISSTLLFLSRNYWWGGWYPGGAAIGHFVGRSQVGKCEYIDPEAAQRLFHDQSATGADGKLIGQVSSTSWVE